MSVCNNVMEDHILKMLFVYFFQKIPSGNYPVHSMKSTSLSNVAFFIAFIVTSMRENGESHQ